LVLAVAVLAAVVAYGLRPMPVEVDLAKIDLGTVRETVDQDGKTRIRERYVVSTPLAGRLQRISLDPGDSVAVGETILASIEPRDPELLDSRAILQAQANVKAAEAKLRRMTPLLEEAVAAEEYTKGELDRVREARKKNPQAITESQVESKLMEYRMRSAVVRSARHAEDIARFELDQARAALSSSQPPKDASPAAPASPVSFEPDQIDDGPPEGDAHFEIRSPINGRVLRVLQESSMVVTPGTPLIEIGDPTDLEAEIDVLSRDAVRIRPGAAVLLEHWGGQTPLHGTVRLVEPAAFTKISTLGVEEQRVNVIVDLVDPPAERATLGDGYRVEASIVVAEATDVPRVPTSALFRIDDKWAVFRVEGGVARSRIVELGLQNGMYAEIRKGLSAGDVVVTHPGDRVTDGVTILDRAR
jgi:HlyD family secretion protein